jgi:hypothetical protein
MAEAHGPEDPEAAPMHHDIDERFSQLHVGAAAVLGIVAIVLGIVFGITLANN